MVGCNRAQSRFILPILLLLALFIGSAQLAYAYDDCRDTGQNPIPICTCVDLNDTRLDFTGNYTLNNTIDCSDTRNWRSGLGFPVIGSTAFSGTLNGQGYNITGLYMSSGATNSVGLFRTISGTVKNVGMIDVNISCGYNCGMLAAYTSGTINNSFVMGNISGVRALGGLVYSTTGTINHSHATTTMTTVYSDESTMGGFIATNDGKIDYSYSEGKITLSTGSTGHDQVGGFAGYGDTGSIISNSYSTVDVTAAESIGGFIGRLYYATIRNCYSTGKVSGYDSVGGFVGYNYGGMIYDSYSRGNATSAHYYCGGFVGHIYSSPHIFTSYSTGYVSGGGSYKGGFLGTRTASGKINSSFWDNQTSIATSYTSNAGEGRLTSAMKDVATFTDLPDDELEVPWDFANNPNDDDGNNEYWHILPTINDGYPFLIGVGIGAGVDYVSPNVTYGALTPVSGMATKADTVQANATIMNAGDLKALAWDWNGTVVQLYNNSLVLMLNFDNVSSLDEVYSLSGGAVYDVSSAENNGTIGNITAWNATGRHGGALNFDGDDDYVNVSLSGVFDTIQNNDFSIEFWANIDDFSEYSTWTTFMEARHSDSNFTQFNIYSANEVQFIVEDADTQRAVAATSLSADIWYHFVGVWDASENNIELYVNGLNSTGAGSATSGPGDGEMLRIGGRTDGAGNFSGAIDEFRVWNKTLSPEEVYVHYISNFMKNDTLSWTFYVNQSRNVTDRLDDGTYTFQIIAKDITGNTNREEIRTLYIDRTPPNITGAVNATAEYGYAFFQQVNATDAVAVDCFTVNDTTNFQINCTGYLQNNTLLEYGLYGLNISVNDTAGNSNTTVIWINVTDTIPPTFTGIENETIEYGSPFIQQINATDLSNVSWFTVNDTDFQINSTGYLENTTLLAIGQYLLNISVNDTFGNTNDAILNITVADTTPPNITGIANQTVEAGNLLTQQINATDLNGTSCFTVNDTARFQINCTGYLQNNTLMSYGYYHLNVSVNDSSNNWNSEIIRINVTDVFPPAFTGIANQSVESGDAMFQQINATDPSNISCFSVNDTSNFTINCTGYLQNSTTLLAGLFWLNITVNDTAGNENSSQMIVNVTDTTAPTVNITYPLNNTNYSINVNQMNYTVTDLEALSACWYSNSSDSPNSSDATAGTNFTDLAAEDGWTNWTVSCNDTWGNIGSDLVNFYQDTTAPTFTGITNDSIEYSSPFTQQINATDVSGVDCFTVSDTTNFTINCTGYLENTTLLEVGIFNLNITVNDTYGKETSAIMWINVSDNIAPTFTGIINDSIEYGSPFTQQINATDLSGIDCFILNDTSNFTINCTGYFENNTRASTGIHNLNVTVNDTSGNLNSALMRINVTDDGLPTFTGIANETIEYGSPFIQQINATDPSGISCFTVNDTDNFQINCTGYLENTTLLAIGQYILNISVNDTFGNTQDAIINITVADTTPPTITGISNQSVEAGDPMFQQINATDLNGTGCFTVNDTTRFQINCTGYLENSTTLGYGFYYLNITVNDSSNNLNSEIIWVNVTDVTPPIFTGIVNRTTEYGNAFFQQINATDPSNIDCFTVNDTANFTINCSGYLQNSSMLDFGLHWVNVTVNDTRGNDATSLIYFNITDITSPIVSLNTPAANYVNDTSLSAVNLTFNCSATDNVLLVNISLYITNYQDTNFALNQTTNVSGTINSSVWTLGLSSGNYTWNCLAYDSSGNSDWGNANRTIVINYTDSDGDSVPDSLDNLEGNESSVNTTGVTDLNISIDGNTTLGTYAETYEVIFYDSNQTILNFTHNFTASKLDLAKVVIIKAENSIIINISGQVQSNYRKTVYIDDNDFGSLCVKDEEIVSISNISSACDGSNETDFTSCIGNSGGVTINYITCTDEGTRLKIENLTYSAIQGTPATSTDSQDPGGGSNIIYGGCIGCSESEICINNTCIEVDCKADADCGKDQYCLDYECSYSKCSKNSDCDKGQYCSKNKCTDYKCSKNSDCDKGQHCSGYECKDYECTENSDCGNNQYCYERTCHDYECIVNLDCMVAEGEGCRDNTCVKLFNILIEDFGASAEIGGFFDFSYLVKAMEDVDEIEVRFWVVKDGKEVSLASDTIYLGDYGEKTGLGKLYVPPTMESGNYEFYIEMTYGEYSLTANKTIEVLIDKVKGVATIREVKPEEVCDIDTEFNTRDYIFTILLIIFITLLFIFYKNQKRKA